MKPYEYPILSNKKPPINEKGIPINPGKEIKS